MTDRGAEMLKIVREIYDEGRDVVERDGPRWPLFPNAERTLKARGVEGLRKSYEGMIRNPGERGTWVKKQLEANGRKTLESDRSRLA